MFSFLRNMKKKMMVAEAFVLFFLVTLEVNSGSSWGSASERFGD